jgi:hypothetical protein
VFNPEVQQVTMSPRHRTGPPLASPRAAFSQSVGRGSLPEYTRWSQYREKCPHKEGILAGHIYPPHN